MLEKLINAIVFGIFVLIALTFLSACGQMPLPNYKCIGGHEYERITGQDGYWRSTGQSCVSA